MATDRRFNIDTETAAEMLGVSEATLWNWKWARRGPEVQKKRGRLYYSESGILRYQMMRELSGKPARHDGRDSA